jgi:hypothetical protein
MVRQRGKIELAKRALDHRMKTARACPTTYLTDVTATGFSRVPPQSRLSQRHSGLRQDLRASNAALATSSRARSSLAGRADYPWRSPCQT